MAQKFLTDIELTRGLKDSSGDLGNSGQVLSSTGTGLNWINATTSASVVYQDGFTGDGNTTAFTLANSLDNENKSQVYIDGVYQHKDTYSLSNTTLTFSTAPPNLSDIEVISFSSVSSADDILYDDDFTSAGLMTTNGSGVYSITTNNSSNWNTAYTYSQVGHLPLTGGTLTGDLTIDDSKIIFERDANNEVVLQFSNVDGVPDDTAQLKVQDKGLLWEAGGTNGAKFWMYNGSWNSTVFLNAGTFNIRASDSTGRAVFNSAGLTITDDLEVDGGNITLGGTGRIQGIDTVSAGTDAANKTYVDTQVANIVDSAPSTLDTLNELAAALGDDANFSTTVTNSIATKMPLAGGTFTGAVQFNDNIHLNIGSSADFKLYHNGSHSYIQNFTGDLSIENSQDDGNITFVSDDGSGGTATYIRIDGGTHETLFLKKIRLNDDVEAQWGTGRDFRIKHNGNNTFLENFTGALYIDQNTDDGSIIFRNDDGSGGVTSYMQIRGNQEDIQFNKTATFASGGTFENDITLNVNYLLKSSYNPTSNFLDFDDDSTTHSPDTNVTTLASVSGIAMATNLNDGGGGAFTVSTGSGGTELLRITTAGNATFTGSITSGAITSSASVIASGNSNSFGNTTVGALTASSITSSGSLSISGNSNSIGTTTFTGNVTFNERILSAYTGQSYHNLKNATSNGTVLRLETTGDSRFLYLQTDHIYSNGALYIGDNSYATNFRGSSYSFSTGNATFSGNVTIEGGTLNLSDGSQYDSIINAGSSLTLNFDDDNNSTGEVFRINHDTTNVNANNLFSITESGVSTASASFRAPIFYDTDNTGRYVAPAETSRLRHLQLWQNGDFDMYVSDVDAWIHCDARDEGTVAAAYKYTRSNSTGYGVYKEYWYDGNSYQSIRQDNDQFVFSTSVSATEFDLPSGGMLDWANGDARIVEGLVNNYSLSFQTYDGSSVTTALRLDGDNFAAFFGDMYIPVGNKFYFGAGSHTYISEDINDRLRFFVGGQEFMRFTEGSTDTANFYTTVRFETTPNVTGNTIWHAGNDGSGSGLDADLLDGQHRSAFEEYHDYGWIDMSNTSTYAEDTYYPVTIDMNQNGRFVNIKIEVALNSGTTPSWSTHNSGFSLTIDWHTMANGWGTVQESRRINAWRERWSNVTIVGGITQLNNSSNEVIWLRGGGKYRFISNKSNLTITPRSSTFTASSQSASPSTSIVNDVWDSARGGVAFGNVKVRNYIEHGDDSDTYMGFNAANSMEFVAGGTQRMSITGDVNVQGTTDLNINGTSRRLNFTAGTGTVRTTTGNNLILQTNSTTALTVDTSQRVALNNQLIVGTFANSQANTGEAWIGRASDRSAGTLTVQLGTGSGRRFEVVDQGWTTVEFQANDSGDATAASSFRAPIFYDSADTSRYVNPNSTSVLGGITMNGTLSMQNNNISGVNHIVINDPGVGEGISWNNGNGWQIYESNDSNNNGAGNLQFASSSTTHRFRIDTNGNTLSEAHYDISDTSYLVDPNSTTYLHYLQLDRYIYHRGDTNTRIEFQADTIFLRTGGTDRIKIDNTNVHAKDTYFKVSGGSTLTYGSGYLFHAIESSRANEPILMLHNTIPTTSSQHYGLNIVTAANHNNTTSRFMLGQGGTSEKIKIYSNGNIQNLNNSYGQLSDINLKENIIDATPKLDDINQVRVVNFNYIDDLDEDGLPKKQIGVVAQELEEIFPGMVYECGDTETPTKAVKYSVFVPMLIKAVQELTQEVQTLKNQINGIN